MGLLVWIVLFTVAVSDAREHRIPNKGLLAILLLSLIDKALLLSNFSLLFWSVATGLACFICALVLYFLKVMAAGDVKLLGVVGFWLGPAHIYQAVFWIAISSVVVGLFYVLLRVAQAPDNTKSMLSKYSLLAMYGASDTKPVGSKEIAQRERYRMPFAPVVVLGIAVYFYFLNQ